MCDTSRHLNFDAALVELQPNDLTNPAWFEQVKGHQYQDECCAVEMIDGKVYWKATTTLEYVAHYTHCSQVALGVRYPSQMRQVRHGNV